VKSDVRNDTLLRETLIYCGAPSCKIYMVSNKREQSRGRLRTLMRSRRVSRAKLATTCGVSVSTVARWLREGLEGGHLFYAANALGCSASYLIGVRDSQEKPVFLREDQIAVLAVWEALSGQERAMAMEAFKAARKALRKAARSS
jgi:transcriptional regulator with XRE-family HTH domain